MKEYVPSLTGHPDSFDRGGRASEALGSAALGSGRRPPSPRLLGGPSARAPGRREGRATDLRAPSASSRPSVWMRSRARGRGPRQRANRGRSSEQGKRRGVGAKLGKGAGARAARPQRRHAGGDTVGGRVRARGTARGAPGGLSDFGLP